MVEIEAKPTTMKKKQNVVIHYYEPFDDEGPLIGIYGDPDGLRALAEALLEAASFDQSNNLVQSEGEYWKIRATQDESASFFVLHDLSLRLNIGRLDCAKDGSFDWFLGPVEARRASDSEVRGATTKEMEPSEAPKPPNGTF
jgi:hypothetical protein